MEIARTDLAAIGPVLHLARASRRSDLAPVSRDEIRVDPLQVGLGQAAQELPGEVERLLDGPALLALVDEPVLEVVREGEVAAVSLGERRLADDRDEPAQVAPARKRRVELVGDGAMVLAGLARRRCRRS